MAVVAAAAPAFCAVSELLIAFQLRRRGGQLLRELLSETTSIPPSVLKMPTLVRRSTLCVGVLAPVRWRNANDPRLHSR